MKLYPPSMTPEQALRAGYLGKLECRQYLDWLKRTFRCDTCDVAGTDHNPIDPSHFNGYKGAGTKAPDGMAIPQCRECHELYERGLIKLRGTYALPVLLDTVEKVTAANKHMRSPANGWRLGDHCHHDVFAPFTAEAFLCRVVIYNAIWLAERV